jgi:hypothetical protein
MGSSEKAGGIKNLEEGINVGGPPMYINSVVKTGVYKLFPMGQGNRLRKT